MWLVQGGWSGGVHVACVRGLCCSDIDRAMDSSCVSVVSAVPFPLLVLFWFCCFLAYLLRRLSLYCGHVVHYRCCVVVSAVFSTCGRDVFVMLFAVIFLL